MGLKAALTSLFYFLKLSVQFLSLLVKAKYSHWRATGTFTKILIQEGFSKEIAKELAQVYPNPIKEALNLMNLKRFRGKD